MLSTCKEAEEWLQSAAAEGEEEAWLEPGNLKLESGAHDSIKKAYFSFYLAQTAKLRDAEAPLQKAGTQLNEKEIASVKTVDQWRHLPETGKKIKLR